MTSTARSDESPSRPRWPWVFLALALAWSAAIRVPLILNAATHLDSDLAVDGLTLFEAIHGHWRWHYPGTPHIGIVPVLLSWPQAMVWGANPVTLVSGGTVAYLGLVVATFVLAWRAFGPRVAAWSLVPLAFASTGSIWLSGWITGGHLLAAAWHAGAFSFLHACLARGGPRRAMILGLWCGLGVYIDSMFVVTLAGIVPAAVAGWWAFGRSRRGFVSALAFLPAFLIGAAPREVGARLDPHNAYRDQFQVVAVPEVLADHARILALDCLPRLIVGHRLPELQADPDPAALAGPGPTRFEGDMHPGAIALTILGFALWLAATAALIRALLADHDVPARAVAAGLLISMGVVLAAFVVSRNIFNSDNYRYLVDLLVPWAVGFGLACDRRARRGRNGFVVASAGASLLAGLMTIDAARWYARFGWIDARRVPVRKAVSDPALAWLEAHPAVRDLSGGYWDVYRLSFLTGGRIRGIPYPVFPDRFPEWSRGLSGGHPSTLLYRPTPEGNLFLLRAKRAGGKNIGRAHGAVFISWP
jgi:hypothetical protein